VLGSSNEPLRRLAFAAAFLGLVGLVAGCGSGGKTAGPTVASATTTSSPSRPAVAVDALDGLLLSPAEIGTAMGAPEVPAKKTLNQMADTSAGKPDKNCRFTQPAESSIYAKSGWNGVRSQELQEPVPNFAHHVIQAVVSFPDANGAASFFKASAQFWPLCANHEYRVLSPGGPDKIFTMGPIDNTDGILRTTDTLQGGDGWACQRALTASNNVIIDVAACATNPAPDVAVNIARQIAEKVAKL
jgi:serine/threonine kinase PknH